MSCFEIATKWTKKKKHLKLFYVRHTSLRGRDYLEKTYEMEGQSAMHGIYYQSLVLAIYATRFQS